MSEEIVVGACYETKDGEIIRVTEHKGALVTWTHLVKRYEEFHVSEDRFATYGAVRVADPTPAVIVDAEPPLAGEMTLRQVEAWRVRRGIDDVHGEIGLMYTGRTRLWHAWAERDGKVLAKTSSSDPQDAITALMDKVTR